MKKKIEEHLIKKDEKPKPPPEVDPNAGEQQLAKHLFMGIAGFMVYTIATQVMNK